MDDEADGSSAHLLHHFGITPEQLIASGMEAEVYRYGTRHVIKFYHRTMSRARLQTLQQFYAGLDTGALSYALPRIDRIYDLDGALVSVESLIEGQPLDPLLPTFDTLQFTTTMHRYLAAVLELQGTRPQYPRDRYKLFDEQGISSTADGDWHHFLARLLGMHLEQVAPYLAHDVADFHVKVQQLMAILARPYQGANTLIHGDFYPGNLLVDVAGRVVGLLDFGSLTMIGDYLFDIATSWVFFDMYDSLRANARERYLEVVLDRLGEHVRGVLYRYVVLYSMLSATTYSATGADGHYQWCVANLNNAAYWEGLA